MQFSLCKNIKIKRKNLNIKTNSPLTRCAGSAKKRASQSLRVEAFFCLVPLCGIVSLEFMLSEAEVSKEKERRKSFYN